MSILLTAHNKHLDIAEMSTSKQSTVPLNTKIVKSHVLLDLNVTPFTR